MYTYIRIYMHTINIYKLCDGAVAWVNKTCVQIEIG